MGVKCLFIACASREIVAWASILPDYLCVVRLLCCCWEVSCFRLLCLVVIHLDLLGFKFETTLLTYLIVTKGKRLLFMIELIVDMLDGWTRPLVQNLTVRVLLTNHELDTRFLPAERRLIVAMALQVLTGLSKTWLSQAWLQHWLLLQ